MKLLRITGLGLAILGLYGQQILKAEDYVYRAAGVLPYAVDASGRTKILLGLSSVHADQASDFGGLRDSIDGFNPLVTAAREGCEELMFIFDGDSSFNRILTKRYSYKKGFDISKAHSATYKRLIDLLPDCPYSYSERYIMHFIQVPYQPELPKRFLQRKAAYAGKLPHCWNETVRMVWADLEAVLVAINVRTPGNPVIIDGVTLYEPFVRSLIVAQENKLIGA